MGIDPFDYDEFDFGVNFRKDDGRLDFNSKSMRDRYIAGRLDRAKKRLDLKKKALERRIGLFTNVVSYWGMVVISLAETVYVIGRAFS